MLKGRLRAPQITKDIRKLVIGGALTRKQAKLIALGRIRTLLGNCRPHQEERVLRGKEARCTPGYQDHVTHMGVKGKGRQRGRGEALRGRPQADEGPTFLGDFIPNATSFNSQIRSGRGINEGFRHLHRGCFTGVRGRSQRSMTLHAHATGNGDGTPKFCAPAQNESLWGKTGWTELVPGGDSNPLR